MDLITVKERLRERIQVHTTFFEKMVAEEYRREVNEWGGSHFTRRLQRKGLPFSNLQELFRVQYLGILLDSRNPIGISIINKLVSYTIGGGHTYEVAPRRGQRLTAKERTAIEAAIFELTAVGWAEQQEESFRRRLRTGDVFRRYAKRGNELVFHHLDSFEIDPKQHSAEAPFGIKYKNNDMLDRKTYYVDGEPDEQVQHAKYGVDGNVDRGLPLLWMGYLPLSEIEELDRALTDIAYTHSEYAAVHAKKPNTGAGGSKGMDTITGGLVKLRQAALAQGRKSNAGNVHIADDYDVELAGDTFSPLGWLASMDSKASRVAAIADVPKWMVIGSAEGSALGANTLISSEAPLTRRVMREGKKQGAFDVELFLIAASAKLGRYMDLDFIRDLGRRASIEVNIPIPATQERSVESERVRAEVAAGLLDVPTGIKLLGHDPEIVRQRQAEWDEETRESGYWRPAQLREAAEAIAALTKAGIELERAVEMLNLDPDDIDLQRAVLRAQTPPPQPEGEPDDDGTTDGADPEADGAAAAAA
jgi:hypothetical protein